MTFDLVRTIFEGINTLCQVINTGLMLADFIRSL